MDFNPSPRRPYRCFQYNFLALDIKNPDKVTHETESMLFCADMGINASTYLMNYAPEQMMFDETGRFNNPQNMALMESLGCEIFYFKEGPNTFILN